MNLRIRSVDENDKNFDLNQVFVGDATIEKGTFQQNKFSLAGFPEDIANSIVGAINNYSQKDEDFNMFAISSFNRVIVYTNRVNEYWNSYEYLMFSEDLNFENVVNVPYRNFESLSEFNSKRAEPGMHGATAPPFLDYDSLVIGATSMFVDENFKILQSNLTGGNNEPKNRIRVPKQFQEYFSLDLYLRTQDWYSKIVSIDAYLDEPIFENGRISNFKNIDSYVTINLF